MKERPILFSGAMVRALLDGSKTQTRRIVKPQPAVKQGMVNAAYCGDRNLWLRDGPCDSSDPAKEWRCPYGLPGDRLWVRETFYCDHCFYPDGTPPSCYWDGDKPRAAHTPEQLLQERADMLESMYYRADGEPEWEAAESPTTWRPSIHMPRWASRLNLDLVSVRVERLQDISEADALAEGIVRQPDGGYGLADTTHYHATDPRICYWSLWDHINGAGSVESNPFVWVLGFPSTTTPAQP